MRNKLISAGLLLYRLVDKELEFFIAHPGGPFFAKRQLGAFTIPKGLVEEGEALLDAACREFGEEIGFTPPPPFTSLGSVTLKSGKTVHAWAVEGSTPPGWELKSNYRTIEWPKDSGQMKTFPEVDAADFYPSHRAKALLNPAQSVWVDHIVALHYLQLSGKEVSTVNH